jgi:Abortive infection C-terminus
MERPRIYGDERSCRTALGRYIGRGEELLDQAEGVQNRIDAVASHDLAEFYAVDIQGDWEKDVRRWFSNARDGMGRYLQDQMGERLPVLALGLPPDDGKPRHTVALDNGVPWVAKAVEELQDLQAAIGVRRDVAATSPTPARFAELRASGLVDEKVIDDRAKEMLSPRTPRQLYNAIGAAKELTEATLKAALDRLGEPRGRSDELPLLMKKWRRAIRRVAPPDSEGVDALDRAQNALASLVVFLAEWRNAYGRGHGRPQYPPGLAPRHARLAADAAETCVRFIVMTMDDLRLLPPRQSE